MPLCTLHLISLNPQTSIYEFITSLRAWGVRPLILSKVIRWIITPTKIDTNQLLQPSTPYSLLLIVSGTKPLPGPLEAKLSSTLTLQIGIPSRLLADFTTKNQTLLHPPSADSVPKLTGALSDPIINPQSSQTLTLSPELQHWIDSFNHSHAGKNAVSMLNLLAFKPDMKASYLEYGKAFAETIGSKRGGDAKLVGHVVYPSFKPSAAAGAAAGASSPPKWDEFALAHYPSIMHFADMLASKDYQAVNQKYRVPALEDTCILCTSEIDVEEIMRRGDVSPKL